MTDAFDLKAVQGDAHFLNRGFTGRGPCAEFRDHRVIVHADLAAFIDAGIVAHDAVVAHVFFGRTIAGQATDRGQEVAIGVFGIQTVFNRPAVDFHIVLRDRQGLAIGDADHLFHEVDTGDQLGHGVFHLQTGVHFEEVEVLVAIHDEFDRTGTGVPNGLGQCDGLFAHGLAGGLIKERRRGLFDDLLVPALNRAFALIQIDAVAMCVAQDLNFDVARLGDEFLDKDTVVAKAVCRLVLGRLEPFAGLVVVPCDAHALTAAPGRGLDHHRIADFVADLDGLIGVLNQPHVARNGRHVGVLGNFLGRDLVAHGFNRAFGRADKGHASGLKRLGELAVFRQETIAGVHRLGAGFADRLHDLVDHDIGLVGRRRADVIGLIRHFHMQRVLVRIRIDRNRFDTHFTGCFDNTARDFAAVRDQDLVEHYPSLPSLGRARPGQTKANKRPPGRHAPMAQFHTKPRAVTRSLVDVLVTQP